MSERDAAWDQLQRSMLDAVADVVAGSEWGPPEGAVLTEVVVVMGWTDLADGAVGYGQSSLRCGSPWGTEGLVIREARRIARHDSAEDDASEG